MMDEIKQLSEELSKAREAYYNLSPIISDEEYDRKRDKLKELCPDHFEVKTIGADPPIGSIWEKIPHEIPMGSLDKANSEEEIDKWASKSGVDEFHITHKVDGSSMELVYKNGSLLRCVTRGNGIIGEDVTQNIKHVPSIPEKISVEVDVTIRGEIVMMKDVFLNKYSELYANPRNTAAAKVREKKNNECGNLTFIAYWAKFNNQPKTMSDLFEWLKSRDFMIPDYKFGDLNAIKSYFKKIVTDRPSIPYEIDGQVVSVNNIEVLENLGEVAMRPRGQIAWKFQSEKAESKVIDVVWGVGPTGRVTPVAKIEPTKIGGVTIESVSLHNLKMFHELNLFRGCRVLVARRQDVIPYIESRID